MASVLATPPGVSPGHPSAELPPPIRIGSFHASGKQDPNRKGKAQGSPE